MRESALEKIVCREAKALGISTYKLAGPNDRGKPDRIFMRNGVAAFVELKAPGEKPTKLQMKNLQEREADGFNAQWFDNPGEAINWLRAVFGLL